MTNRRKHNAIEQTNRKRHNARKKAIAAITAFGLISGTIAPLSPITTPDTAYATEIGDTIQQIKDTSDTLETALDQYNAAIQERDDAQAEIDKLAPSLENAKNELNEICVWKYKNENHDLTRIILGADNVTTLINQMIYVQKTEDQKQQALDKIATISTQLEQKKQEAEQAAQQAQQVQTDSQSQLDSLNATLEGLRAEQRESLGYNSIHGGGPAYEAEPGSDVVDYALSRIGCPYVWGAAGPTSFDCSGLVVWAYKQIGISLPHQTESLKAAADEIIPISESQPGDVLYRPGHVGIVTKAGGVEYVHAPTFGAYVRNTDSIQWSGFTCALRFYH